MDFAKVIKTILEYFPETRSIIVSGSSVDDSYIENVSDIDMLIVDNEKEGVQDKLIEIQKKLGEKYDIHHMIMENLSTNLTSVTPSREYKFHGLDTYRLKNQNKVIYGDSEIIKNIPDISFDEALLDIVPYVKEKMIPDLKSKLGISKNTADFIFEESGRFLVILRTMYSVKTGIMSSKMQALDYARKEYSYLSNFVDSLKMAYLGEKPVPIKVEDIERVLEEAETVFEEYLGKLR